MTAFSLLQLGTAGWLTPYLVDAECVDGHEVLYTWEWITADFVEVTC